jgi:PAS domain S-box-containing protein
VLPEAFAGGPAEVQAALAAAVAAAPTGIVIADPNLPDCPIVFANPAFFAITGYAPEQVIGRNCRFLQGPGTEPGTVHRIRRAITERQPVSVEIVNYRRDGRRFVNELRIAPVLDGAGNLACFVGIQHDVTARVKAERAAEKARRAAEHASAEKSDFLAFVSHEVRTPMNGVMGTISLLLDTELDAEQRAYAETARRCGQALLATVNEILDFARIEAGKLDIAAAPFALAEPVREVLDLLAPAAAEKGIALAARIDPALPARIVGDQQRTRQVLLNLVDNAVKFTAVGGVEIRLAPADSASLLAIEVADTGIGIAPAVQARLFRRFAQGEAGRESGAVQVGGSGLGLAICKRLVELMGGQITLESAPGRGTTFRVLLPLMPVAESGQPPERLRPTPEAARPPAGARGRILLAEDGQANQLVAAAILRKAGYAVDLAHDGQEAVAAARTRAYDLILMDVRMPAMDGFAATAAIRALPAPAGRTPIVAMTASVLAEDRERCLAAGMDGHLPKPMDKAQLLAGIAAVLEARPRRPRAAPPPREPHDVPSLLDRQTLDELRAAVGPGRLPRLLAVFAEETRERLGRFARSDELAAIENEAHGLKSAAGTFGAAALREAAAAIEEACHRGDHAAALAGRDALPGLVARTFAAYPVPLTGGLRDAAGGGGMPGPSGGPYAAAMLRPESA